jgi:hypothetical protein
MAWRIKLVQPKARDTEEGPTPAAPPRTEGVAGCPDAPSREAREGAVQRGKRRKPLRGSYANAGQSM